MQTQYDTGMADDPQHMVIVPLPNRLAWTRPEGSSLKLLYLNWGIRYYGRQPSPLQDIRIWYYVVIRKGTPRLVAGRQELQLQPREVVIVHPECPRSFRDDRNRSSDVLGWQWTDAPRCEECVPAAKNVLHWKLSVEDMDRVEQIHAKCREEMLNQDKHTPLALEQLRMELDVALARSRQPVRQRDDPNSEIQRAIEWMEQHLDHANPVHLLCDYLQLSPSTLRRLFLRHHKKAPATVYQQLKMEHAQRLLRHKTVKEVAYALGYHHPGDFSKAYKEFFGTSPKRQRELSPS